MKHVDRKDDPLRIGGIVDHALQALERSANYAHAGAAVDQWVQAELQPGGHDRADSVELAQKPGFVIDRNEARE